MFGWAKSDLEEIPNFVNCNSANLYLFNCFLNIFFMFPEFLLGLFGQEFKIGVTAFIFLSCGRLISSFSGSVGNILQMTGNQDIYAKILFVGAILNITLNLILIPDTSPLAIFNIVGINGAAFASMSSLIIWNISMVFVVKKKFGFYTFYMPFIKRWKVNCQIFWL